jgi:hypothetical protein
MVVRLGRRACTWRGTSGDIVTDGVNMTLCSNVIHVSSFRNVDLASGSVVGERGR